MFFAMIVMGLLECMLFAWGVHLSQDDDLDNKQRITHERAEVISAYMDSFDAFKKSKPVYVMAMGPMASGKSRQEKFLVNDLMQRPNNSSLKMKSTPQYFLIDDYVETDQRYKQEVRTFLKGQLGDTPTDDQVTSFVDKADDEVTGFFKDVYMDVRGDASARFKADLENALKAKTNIVYETTGSSPLDEKIKYAQSLSGSEYAFVAAVSSVDFCKLLERNMGRAADMVKNFMKNETAPAPRLQVSWANAEAFGAGCKKIEPNLKFIVDCLEGKAGNAMNCAPEVYGPIEEMCVFDNNGDSLKLIACIQHGDPKGQAKDVKDALKRLLPPDDVGTCKSARPSGDNSQTKA